MTKFDSSQEWLEQSALLIQARPTTTKISTKYKIKKPSASFSRRRTQQADSVSSEAPAPLGVLAIKTYDPVSGTVLSYSTTKAQEVGRLVGSLGKLGRSMAALPELAEPPTLSTKMDIDAQGSGAQTPITETAPKATTGGTDTGPNKKKKKKGKK